MEPINASSLLKTGMPLWKKLFIVAVIASIIIAVFAALSEMSKPTAPLAEPSNEMPISTEEKAYIEGKFSTPAPVIEESQKAAIEESLSTPAPEIPDSQKVMLEKLLK